MSGQVGLGATGVAGMQWGTPGHTAWGGETPGTHTHTRGPDQTPRSCWDALRAVLWDAPRCCGVHRGESGTHHTPHTGTHHTPGHTTRGGETRDTHARVKGGPGQAPLGAAGVHRGALGCTAAPRSAQRRAALFRECRDPFRGRGVVSARGGLCLMSTILKGRGCCATPPSCYCPPLMGQSGPSLPAPSGLSRRCQPERGTQD